MIRKKRVARSKLGVPRDENWRQDRGLDPLVVVRVDAHVLLLRGERELANVKSLGKVTSNSVGYCPMYK